MEEKVQVCNTEVQMKMQTTMFEGNLHHCCAVCEHFKRGFDKWQCELSSETISFKDAGRQCCGKFHNGGE